MSRPIRLLTTLALLASSSLALALAGCGGGSQGIDEEIDAGGYAPPADSAVAEPVPVDDASAPADPAP